MRNIFLTMTLLSTTLAFADSGEEIAAVRQPAVEPIAQPHFIEYHNRIAVFGPLHQVYERIKTDALYAGVECWFLPTWNNDVDHRDNALGEAEFRMGYNFFYNGRDHVTPFAGVGLIRDFTKERDAKKGAIGYGVLGFLYDHEFNRCVNLGMNFKLLAGAPLSERLVAWGSPVVGFDIAVPLTFRFGYQRHWDFRLEPFDIYLHGSKISRNYFGFRSTIGYRF